MKEFGSDFHIVSDFDCVKNINFPTLGGLVSYSQSFGRDSGGAGASRVQS